MKIDNKVMLSLVRFFDLEDDPALARNILNLFEKREYFPSNDYLDGFIDSYYTGSEVDHNALHLAKVALFEMLDKERERLRKRL